MPPAPRGKRPATKQETPVRIRTPVRPIIDRAIKAHPMAAVVDVMSAMVIGWDMLTPEQQHKALNRAKGMQYTGR